MSKKNLPRLKTFDVLKHFTFFFFFVLSNGEIIQYVHSLVCNLTVEHEECNISDNNEVSVNGNATLSLAEFCFDH